MPTIAGKKNLSFVNVDEEKNELAIKLLALKDVSLIHAFKVIFDDLTSKKKRITKSQYNKEIDAAVKRVNAGLSISNEEVMKEMDTW